MGEKRAWRARPPGVGEDDPPEVDDQVGAGGAGAAASAVVWGVAQERRSDAVAQRVDLGGPEARALEDLADSLFELLW